MGGALGGATQRGRSTGVCWCAGGSVCRIPSPSAADYVGYLEDHQRKQTGKLEGMRKEVKALEIMKE